MSECNRENYSEVSAFVRKLCKGFMGEYWKKPDLQGAYMNVFVKNPCTCA